MPTNPNPGGALRSLGAKCAEDVARARAVLRRALARLVMTGRP